ncbi:MAG TPA: alpha/beta hydrolase [Flexilinea sp.]|nr:alpha/beta hydrolase [Flexilinea sp.]HRY20668.1 alpha/beta hydrolase [Flexilinea sp.]
MNKKIRILLSVLGIILILLGAGLMIWNKTTAEPMPEALAFLESDPDVTVETGHWLIFTPASEFPDTGFIFYPGAHVDYRAYAPAAHQIAAEGFLVIIVQMPLGLAVFNTDAAKDVQATYPQIRHWAIGGHSLGGAMAAAYAKSHPESIEGLVLWAAYPSANDSLADSEIRVVSVFGSEDGLATSKKIEASKQLLPPDTIWVKIEGGNHAQFGWYGDQAGDNVATVSREKQQEQTISATIKMLEQIK